MTVDEAAGALGTDARSELLRLQSLHALGVLDSGPEAAFDALARTASIVCGTPIALISLVDSQRQWFKANIGLPGVTQTPRDISFCAHAIAGEGVFEVPSALSDARFLDNPLVTGGPGIRFYAGATIVLDDGSRVGTLCVLDRQPRRLDDTQREALACLAQAVAHALDGRRAVQGMQRMATDLGRLSLVARRTANAVVITDSTRRITWVNEGFERLTGYAAHEVVGKSPGSLLQFEGTERETVRRLREALDAGRSFEGEILNRARDGHTYWLAIEIQPLHDAQGSLTGFMAIELDITERKRVAMALEASKRLLDATGRIAGVGGWALDPATHKFHWTDEVCRILDLPPGRTADVKEFIGHFAAEAQPLMQRAIAHGLDSDSGWDHELRLTTSTGREIWVRSVGEGEYSDDGLVRIVGALQDITARRAMEREIARSAQLLRGAIDTLDEAFVLYDPDDRIALCNDKYRALYPLSSDLLVIGAHFEDVKRQGALRGQYPQAMGRVDEWVAERLASHRAGNTSLLEKLEDGRTLRIVERRMPDGHTVGFRIDVSDLVRATEVAERAHRAQAEFIATMSHELRTPLQSIIGFAELGGLFAQADPRFEAMFADIQAGGHRMLRLVNDLLDVAKIDGTLGSLTLEPANLATLVRDVAAELQPQTAERALRIGLPQPLPRLMADVDAYRFQQVVRNVLANAVRYAPAGSVIEVSLEDLAQDGVEVCIRDHGPGIPPDEFSTIFDAFVQSNRTRDGSGGTGLGLTICRKIMSALGGDISAANAEGGGASMRIWLPAAAPTDAVPAAPGHADTAAAPRTPTRPEPSLHSA